MPNGLSWPLSASVSGTLNAGTPNRRASDPGGSFPDAAIRIGAGHDSGDRAARGETLELVVMQRIGLEQAREIERGVVGRGETVLEGRKCSSECWHKVDRRP